MKNIALASLLLFAACSCDKESTLSSTPVVTAAKDKWEFYKDWLGYWRWRQTAPNGRIVGASSEGYNNKQDAVDNAKREGYTE